MPHKKASKVYGHKRALGTQKRVRCLHCNGTGFDPRWITPQTDCKQCDGSGYVWRGRKLP